MAPIIAPLSDKTGIITTNLNSCNLPLLTNGHFLGTDYLGRDLYTQAVWGARGSLIVGGLASLLAITLGWLWGSISAVSGKKVDYVMMRLVDILLSVPSLILLLVLQSIVSAPFFLSGLPPIVLQILGVNEASQGLLPLFLVIIVVAATSWLESARLSRGQVLGILSQDYISAGIASGAGRRHILLRHIIPNTASIMVIEASLLMSDAILMEAGLSFMGLGLGPNTPSWGTMLEAAQQGLLEGNWWAALVPGVLLTLTVLAVNIIGESYSVSRSGLQVVAQQEL
jgi:ABC-type dipeptide/oligopeptide/nickel transport system permease subunit